MADSGLNKNVVGFFLFVLSMLIVGAISISQSQIGAIVTDIPIFNLILPFPGFDSPTYILLPIVGFFMLFFMIDWVNSFFETKFANSFWFLLLFILLSLLAFYVSTFWLLGEFSLRSGRGFPVFDFWAELRGSAFYLFFVSGMLAWVSKQVINRL